MTIAQINADIARLAPAAWAESGARLQAKGWDGHVIGSPIPAGEHLYGLAQQLIRPVSQGHTNKSHAVAALLNAVLAAERKRQLGTYQGKHVFRGVRDTFLRGLEAETRLRDHTEYAICQELRPLIGRHAPRNEILAAAHSVNGRNDFPLTESEVNAIAANEVWHALPPAPAVRRHVR